MKKVLVLVAALALIGCEGQTFPARATCRAAARALTLACEYVPATTGGEVTTPPEE